MDVANTIEPPQTDAAMTYLVTAVPPEITQTQFNSYYNLWLSTFQSKSETPQGVNALSVAVSTANTQYMIMQNDMMLTQLKLIAANTANINAGISTLNINFTQNPSTGETGSVTVTIPQELISYAKIGMFTSVGICACLLFMILLKAIHARHPF